LRRSEAERGQKSAACAVAFMAHQSRGWIPHV